MRGCKETNIELGREIDLSSTFSPLERRVLPVLTRLNLQTRMRVLVLVGLLVVLGGLGFLGMTAVSQSSERAMQQHLVMAELIAGEIDSVLTHAKLHLDVVAHNANFNRRSSLPEGYGVAFGMEDTAESRQEWLGQLAESYPQVSVSFSQLILFTPEARFFEAYPALDPVRASLVDGHPEVILAIRDGKPLISNLTTISSGERGILFVLPLTRQSVRYGALVGEFQLPTSRLSDFRVGIGETGHLNVIDGNGIVIGGRQNQLFRPNEHPQFYPALLESRQLSVGTAQYIDGNDDHKINHVMAFAPLTSAPWGVGVGVGEAEAMAYTWDLRNRLALMGGITIIAGLVIAWVGTEIVAKPVRVLEEAAQRIIAGDLGSHITLPHKDELGALAQSLDTARERLKNSREQLERWNRELEEKVTERTQELRERNVELTTLHSISTSINQSAALDNTVKPVLDVVRESLEMNAAWIIIKDQENRLHVGATSGASTGMEYTDLESAACLDCISHFMERPEDPIKLGRAIHCSYLGAIGVAETKGLDSFACTGLMSPEGGEGVLLVSYSGDKTLQTEKQRLLENIGYQLGLGMRNTRLFRERSELQTLREVDRLRAEFISGISHELRSPLGVIKGYVTTLQRRDVSWDEDTRQEFLNIIVEESDRLLELIENLLDTSTIHQRRLVINPKPVPPAKLLRNVADKMAKAHQGHRIECRLTEPIPTIFADPHRIEQVVQNLIDNAVKYSPKGSSVTVKGEIEDEWLKITVLDEGIGIPAASRDRVFDAFYRVDSTATRLVGGVGLGLTICKGLVEAHGGRIWAEARVAGGSAVSFILPLANPDAQRQECDGDEDQEINGILL